MKYILVAAMLINVGLLSSCKAGWLDYRNELWDIEPIYVSADSISFSDDKNSLEFYIENPGPHNEISYSISSELKWLTVFPIDGKVRKNEDTIITAKINRTLLEEGRNAGVLNLSIENQEYTKRVSAIGQAKLQIAPESLDFGASSSSKTITIYSTTGYSRAFIFSSNNDWIKISPKMCVLSENPNGSEEFSKHITVDCSRSKLETGTHEGSITIRSEKGTYNSEYKVIITIPIQGTQTQQIGDYIFTLSKIYRLGDGTITIEMTIENASSMYRTFTLNSSHSFATDNEENRYTINADPVNIKKKSSAIMKLSIMGVPEQITEFASLEFDYYLSTKVIFNDISL